MSRELDFYKNLMGEDLKNESHDSDALRNELRSLHNHVDNISDCRYEIKSQYRLENDHYKCENRLKRAMTERRSRYINRIDVYKKIKLWKS